MADLPTLKAGDASKVLIKHGFRERLTKSSHRVYVHPDGRRTVLTFHPKPLTKGVLRSVLKQTNLTIQDLTSR
ncbi:MAG: type II toxin-antitoxin system HicA family toxin [Patescibacteria group bacterium]